MLALLRTEPVDAPEKMISPKKAPQNQDIRIMDKWSTCLWGTYFVNETMPPDPSGGIESTCLVVTVPAPLLLSDVMDKDKRVARAIYEASKLCCSINATLDRQRSVDASSIRKGREHETVVGKDELVSVHLIFGPTSRKDDVLMDKALTILRRAELYASCVGVGTIGTIDVNLSSPIVVAVTLR